MTPLQFRRIKKALRLNNTELSAALKLSEKHGPRHLRRIESGEIGVTGPIEVCMTLFLDNEKYVDQFRNKVDSNRANT